MKKTDSRIRWKATQAFSKMFWDRLVKEYLPFIQIRANWNKPTKRLTINDMVLVKDDNLTRLQWDELLKFTLGGMELYILRKLNYQKLH